jgi:hypothetical protein
MYIISQDKKKYSFNWITNFIDKKKGRKNRPFNSVLKLLISNYSDCLVLSFHSEVQEINTSS